MSADKPEVGDVWEINDPNVGGSAYATLHVDAKNTEEAEEIAKETVSKFDWEFDELEDVDDISVESVEECDTDD